MTGRGGPRRGLGRAWSRRDFLRRSGGALAGASALVALPFRALAGHGSGLSAAQRRTLDAALARIIPAEGPGDWSAVDAGAGDYIAKLLEGHDIHAGGYEFEPQAPWIRRVFEQFKALPRIKRQSWDQETARLRQVYADGLAELDRRAGGDFAARPAVAQDLVLQSLDGEGHPFFRALYDHTMEGVYAHPVYGGNRDRIAWDEFRYQGDVHAVRFPDQIPGNAVSDGAWNRFGGYAPEEMVRPGDGPNWFDEEGIL